MEEVGVVIEVVEAIFSICETIYNMAMKAKANKERCQEVAQRVKALEELVLEVVQRGPGRISSTVFKALKELNASLNSAEVLMAKFSKTKASMKFLKSGSIKEEFTKVDKRLTDNFQVLSGALLVEQGNVLNKVYDTVKGKRKPRIRTPMPVTLATAAIPVSAGRRDEERCSEQASCISPTASMPVRCLTSPMPMTLPSAATPVSYMMPSMPMYSYMTPMSVPGTMAPVSISTTFVSSSAQVPPTLFSPTTSRSVISITSPMTQNTLQLF